ncbi:DNA polymerase I [Desulfogranum mediterraneum]|uniref:DNA polymerase I n=1 Tax=Desulfogranum mediterraneum TaxID=160661 RepID=UPI0004904AFD|nr:DNA polymerase I [Desulfogranum mediterraneum]
MSEIYLIDGSAYIYRAYHAIKPLTNSTGLPTHAVFGFTTILRKLIKEKNPQYLAVAFDSRGPVFRHALYPQYKANRPSMPEDLVPQIPYIRELVAAYNILSLIEEGQEADDLIASAVRALTDQGHRVVIVSGDKDLLQLVSPQVSLWDPMNNRTMDEAAVAEKYGVSPVGLLDYFALTGDSADNIPGVPGVGPKTAQKLLSSYQTLEGLYGAVGELKPSKMTERIIAHKADAFLSRELIRLNHQAHVQEALPAYSYGGSDAADQDRLRSLFTELEFHTLLKNEVRAAAVPTEHFQLIQDEEALAKLCHQLEAADSWVLDTETDSLDPRRAKLVGISFCIDETAAWYLPCGHLLADGSPAPGQLDRERLLAMLRPILENTTATKIGHNLKYDYAVLAAPQNGAIRLGGPLHDTMVGAWLLDPGRRSYKLDDLCAEIDLRLTPFSEVVQGDKSDDAFTRVPVEAAKDYSCEDVYGSYRLYLGQQETLSQWGILSLMAEVEGPLVRVLAAMENTGIVVDAQVLEGLAEEFGLRLEDCEQAIYRVAGKTFNIQSPRQLGEVLFEDLQLPKGRKTKTGWSTDVKVLEKLAGQHELPALVLSYRNLAKLKSTYVDKLSELRNPESGRVYTSYNQCGTATGRLSSSNPNLQNIPIRSEEGRRIRSSFTVEPGWVLLSGDYSQVDLRVMAHYSQDQELLNAFRGGGDIHRQTASEVFSVAPELVTSEMRRVAKTINFGIVYGMSSYGLANQLDLSRKEAQTFIDRYFGHFSGIQEFMVKVVEQAREDGYVTTLSGRRRFLPDIHSKNKSRREFAERIAINTPIQGTAADIMKLAMLRVDEGLKGLRSQAHLILQIHDELVLEVPEPELDRVSGMLQDAMESAVSLDVPLTVQLHHGQNLGKE